MHAAFAKIKYQTQKKQTFFLQKTTDTTSKARKAHTYRIKMHTTNSQNAALSAFSALQK